MFDYNIRTVYYIYLELKGLNEAEPQPPLCRLQKKLLGCWRLARRKDSCVIGTSLFPTAIPVGVGVGTRLSSKVSWP